MARSNPSDPMAEPSGNDDLEIPVAVASMRFLAGGFAHEGALTDLENVPLAEDTPTPVGPLFRWEHPSGEQVAVYQNEQYAPDGYPFTAAKWVEPTNGAPYWKYTHIAETWADAIDGAEGVADHRVFLMESRATETYDEWVERTGGTAYELSVPWNSGDED